MTATAPDLHEDYARAGFGGKLVAGSHPVLLIVDICMAYLDPASPLYAGVEAVLASNIRLVEAARDADVKVIFTRVVYHPSGADGGLFFRKVPALKAFLPGSPLGLFHPDLSPADDDIVVTKQYASAFFGTSLASTLQAMRTDTVLITGFSTSGCVRATALDALQNGFVPIVVRDGCGDRDNRPHEANLFDLQSKYAEVVDEKEAIEILKRKKESVLF
jgi:maleamate amidohydrolase